MSFTTPKFNFSITAADGRTSASVLAAKRSHQVSKQDADTLAIFSGLFVIAIVVAVARWLRR
jgi:hypothetical protein